MTSKNNKAGRGICRRCEKRVKTWDGAEPVCFLEGVGNWNCATMNAIRDICYEGQSPMPPGVDYRYCEDMKYATIKIDDIEDEKGDSIGMALWVAWYKSRGATDAVWILDSRNPPREPTESELDLIIHHYEALATPTKRRRG